ncbi:MAG TPA: redoxin domain-containing protein [Gemmatimonadales bacterium]|nr:redoxin domain-containing protein [Gemmatimonadales bacterium]
MPPRLLLASVVLLAACSSAAVPLDDVAPLPRITAPEVRALLEESEVPIVLNVWASWCTPCRSEAPLLRRAHDEAGDGVRFIGIDVRDDQEDARAFIAEFGLDGFEHYFDESGAVPSDLAGYGVPLTFFFAPGGTLVHLQSGVIDERTLALQIDELLRR